MMIEQVTEVDSTIMVSRYSILIICTPPLSWAEPMGKIVSMAQLLVMMVELTSETWYELVNSQVIHYEVLYRTQIHNHLT